MFKIAIRGKRYIVKADSYRAAYDKAYAMWFKGY